MTLAVPLPWPSAPEILEASEQLNEIRKKEERPKPTTILESCVLVHIGKSMEAKHLQGNRVLPEHRLAFLCILQLSPTNRCASAGANAVRSRIEGTWDNHPVRCAATT